MADTNGNIVTVAVNSSGWTVTDTLNRHFSIAYTGNSATLSYTDSGNKPQSISLSYGTAQNAISVPDIVMYAASGSTAPNTSSVTCTINTNSISSQWPVKSTCGSEPSPGYSAYQATLTFPAADVNGDQRTFTLDLDSMERLTKIIYPAGGYARYDYSPISIQAWSPNTITYYSMGEVSHKYECPASSGSCSTEYKTTYVPTVALSQGGAGAPYNAQILVTDPLGNKTKTIFSTIEPGQIAPKPTDVYKYDSGGNLMWHQNTTYQTLGSFPIPTDLYFPNTITTTLEDTSSPVSSTVTYNLYATYPAQLAPINASPRYVNVYIDEPTQVTETDFGGTTMRTTTETWSGMSYNGSTFSNTFSASGGHILDRPLTKTVADQVQGLTNSTTYTYDNGANTLGNLTQKSISATNAPTAVTSYAVNSYGQVTSITDPNINTTTFGYTDTWSDTSCAPSSQSSAYPTSVKDPLSETTSYSYNSCLGTIASVTGPNLGQTTSYTYDALQRVSSVTNPDKGGKQACYFDSTPNTVATYTLQALGTSLPSCTTSTATPAGSVAQSVILDGFGRKSQIALLSDPDGATYTNTAYDGNGNVQSVSIPFRSITSSGYTTWYDYDGLNRKTYAYNPDSTSQSSSSYEEWTYSGNATTFRDEDGNQWQRTTDAMGNLTEVLEPSGASPSPTMETDYGYDGFGNLWSVKQWGGVVNSSGSRKRSFIYDGMSHLLSATNPESGKTTYVYDNNGNLSNKTAPAPNTAAANGVTVTTKYGYDSLNRLISKTYTNDAYQSPWTCFQYGLPTTAVSGANQIGRLMNEWTQSYSAGLCSGTLPTSGFLTARQILGYDSMGRVKQEQQCTPSNCSTTSKFSLSNTYDLAGNLITYTNGITNTPGASSEPLTFTQAFGGAGRLQSLTSSWSDALHPASVFSAPSGSSPAYAPQGALANAVFGNALTLSRTYDTRLRIIGETESGSKVVSATPGTAAVTISGNEQSK